MIVKKRKPFFGAPPGTRTLDPCIPLAVLGVKPWEYLKISSVACVKYKHFFTVASSESVADYVCSYYSGKSHKICLH